MLLALPLNGNMICQKSTARVAMHSLKELRAPAKLLGGLALKRGRSERARYAAEAKRYHVLLGISDVDTAIELCNPDTYVGGCDFWLNNRGKSTNEFIDFLLRKKELLKAYRAGDKSVAFEYNELMQLWGIG